MAYIGTKALTSFFNNSFNSINYVGDGTTTIYDLPEVVISDVSILVHIDGVKQHASTYSTSWFTLTFSEAPPNTSQIEVIILGVGTMSIKTPSSNTVGGLELKTPDDGLLGEVLTADGAGNLSWEIVSGGTGVSGEFDGGDSTTVYAVGVDITIDSGGAT